MKHIVCKVVLVTSIIVSATAVKAQTCPSYTYKDNSTIGTQSQLPDGFCVFKYEGQKGIYKSSIKSWNPVIIPNTSNDNAQYMEISDDGKWIVYSAYTGAAAELNAVKGYIINVDGSGKTEFSTTENDPPNTDQPVRTGDIVGWLRESPTGSKEVFYIPGPFNAYARKVDLSGTTPVMGEKRCVFEIENMAATLDFYRGFTAAMWKDQLIARIGPSTCKPGTSQGAQPGYVTIPENGMGKAGLSNRYKYTNECDSLAQCGVTISHDGQLCAYNITWMRNLCAPTKDHNPDMDHRGFVVTRFIRNTESPIASQEMIMSPEYTRGIYWAPAKFRYGDAGKVNFDRWYFSNNKDYLIGQLTGNKQTNSLAQYGLHPSLWMVHLPTNTWTEITSPTNTIFCVEPAVYLTASTSVGQHRNAISSTSLFKGASSMRRLDGKLTIPAGVSTVRVYNLNGKLLWQTSPLHVGTAETVRLPSGVGNSIAIVSME